MKTALLLILAALAAEARCDPPAFADGGRFERMRVDAKKPQELADSFFNPFKIQSAAESGLQKKDGAIVTNEAIVAALGHRGISGILYATRESGDRVIIGDQVFGIGDELTFPEEGKDDPVPLVSGASVVLREVGAAGLALIVSPDGEPARPVNFSLRAFLRP